MSDLKTYSRKNPKGGERLYYYSAQDVKKLLRQKDELISMQKSQLSNGRYYLMSVRPDDLTVEDALESFGFGRNGLG